MMKIIDKITGGWKSFKADYKHTPYFLKNTIGMAAFSGGVTGALYLATMFVLPPPVPQLLLMGAIASAFSAVVCSVLTANTFVHEKRDRTVIESFTNDDGQRVEGPRWAIQRIVKARSEYQQAFNRQAEIKADPLVSEAWTKVIVKNRTFGQ